MEMSVGKILISMILLVWLVGLAVAQEAEDANSPIGIWRGASICASAPPSCHDEQVVYYIEAIPDHPDSVQIRADKIVDGKSVTMGSGPWEYDRAKHTLSMGPEQRRWLLTVTGNRIGGTLTVPQNIVFRRMTLTKAN